MPISVIPKYALLENERRFLVDLAKLPDLEGVPYRRIEDRYVVGTRLRLRSITHSITGQVEFKFCKKYSSEDPVSGAIVNIYLSVDEHAALSALPARLITKRRYQIPHGEEMFGLDVFEGALTGLVLCEAEAKTREASLAMAFPPWSGREVTEDLFFTGGQLCAASSAEWQAHARDQGH